MHFATLDKDTAAAILQNCNQSTSSLSDVVRIGTENLSEEENRRLRTAIFEVFLILGDEIIEPIHALYPELAPAEI